MASLAVPSLGSLHSTGDLWEPYRLLDPVGEVVRPVAAYLGDLQAAGRDPRAAMTPVQASRPPAAAGTTPAATDSTLTPDDAACHQAAKELRLQHPRWIVLWISGTGRYHGYPLYTQRSVILTAEQPAELAALMEQTEQAAAGPRPARRPPPPSPLPAPPRKEP
jgi:hypothetical protein